MILRDPADPALQAASLALGGQPTSASRGFASIELRDSDRHLPHLAPLGYAASVVAGLITVAVLWGL